ncbi:MAG: RagB/SusD family nutrient uptake outer membrane protein [Arachidicoccus sp.]|nr:RagB/SusD family nutrient uptake outer membrane protein [Arachidicoccus sp.]
MFKKNLFIFLISLYAISISCNHLLEEDVKTQISNAYLNTESGFEDGVRACYSYLRTWYGTQSGGWLTVFGTDEYTNGGADPTFNNYTANLNSSNGVINYDNGVWASLYTGINACNAVIAAAPNISGMDTILKNTRLAEARFLRAHYYFLLVQTFGPLQLTLEPTTGASSVATRTPVADIYNTIVSDLQFAIENLPQTATDWGRATKAAAEHSLAKVYITRAGTSAKESTDYANAAALAEDVIKNSNAKLLTKFTDIFANVLGGEENSEVIFSCQYSTNALAGGSSNAAHLDFCSNYAVEPGMVRDLANGRPYSHFKPTEYMLGLYNKTYDSRFNGTFKTVWYCNKPGTYTISGKQVNMKKGDTAFIITDHEVTQSERNAANYSIIAPSQFTTTLWPMNQKFLDSLRTGVNSAAGTKDIIVYRLGETYLLAAEAQLMNGHADSALVYINTLRERAAIQGATAAETETNKNAMDINVGDITLDFILDERARELSGEYMRWFDLVRTGKLLERVKKYNAAAATLIQSYHVLRPIPQQQIDAVEGNNTAFPQNDGY